MLQRIFILYGCIWRGDLEYQLFRLDNGEPCKVKQWRGWGAINNGVLVAGDPMTATVLEEYRIAPEPTKFSVDWADGYRRGEAQKRCRYPIGQPDAFIEGWREAWQKRGRLRPGGSRKQEREARRELLARQAEATAT